jgi:hypothetical protein
MDKSIRIKQEGSHVLLIVNGILIAELPHDAAHRVGKALMSSAKLAEEWANPLPLVADQALAFRCGLPFGLTNNVKIIEEAKQSALYDRDLRRYIRGTPTKIHIGTPGVHQHVNTDEP